jgi:hypothetical protein
VNEAPRNSARDSEALEGHLRNLPPPVPPAHLVERLLSDIPCIEPVEPRKRVASITAWTTAIAVLLLTGFGLVLHSQDDSNPAPPPTSTSPQLALETDLLSGTQETRPCDILPPLSDLY